MFDFLKNTILWKQTFDSEFESGFWAFRQFDNRRLAEKRAYYRERGQGQGMTPAEAAFRTYEEFADEYRREIRDDRNAEKTIQQLAGALEAAAPYQDRNGNYKPKRDFLPKHWHAPLDAHRALQAEESEARKVLAEEIRSFRFLREEINAAWANALAGDVPSAAKRVWRWVDRPRVPHEIAESMEVPLRDVMFWLIVFREHLLMTERVHADVHKFSKEYTSPAHIAKKPPEVQRLVGWLDG